MRTGLLAAHFLQFANSYYFPETAFINQSQFLDRIAQFVSKLAPFAAKIAPPCLFDGKMSLR
jgi:hypothetical protein